VDAALGAGKNDAVQSGSDKNERRKAAIALSSVLVTFTALVLPTVGGGVGSWDSHKIQVAVRALLDRGLVMLSRPPGHPTTEFYLFGGLGRLLEKTGFGTFNVTIFLTLQWAVAVALGGVFYGWLRRSGIAPLRAALAVFALMFSPQFLDQAVNGEEILFGMLFVWGALFILARDPEMPLRGRRMAAAVGLFALAIGCRAEYVLCAAIFLPLALIQRGVRAWRAWLLTAAGAALAVALVWLPVLPVIWRDGSRAGDVADILGAPVLLIWGYKVLFHSFGFPVSLVFAVSGLLALGGLVAAIRARRTCEWTVLGAVLVVAVFLGLFLFQPGKPAYVLVCLPFLLWLTARRHVGWLLTVGVLTAIGACVGLDIFKERRLVAPHFVAGAYRAALDGKPVSQRGYLEALSKIEVARKSAIVGDAWSWVYEYHLERGTWRGAAKDFGRRRGRAYVPAGGVERVLLPREVTFVPGVLRRFHEEGYEIVMDRTLWRTIYARYELVAPTQDRVMLGDIPMRLVPVVAEE